MPPQALSGSFYVFFVYVEPFLTILGAIYAIVFSETYHSQLIPNTPLKADPASLFSLRVLGNVYFLLAFMSYYFLPALATARIHEMEKLSLLRRFFTVLAVA